MRNMIELMITGGLGNQMFQYACARALQLENNDDFQMNTGLFGADRFGRSYSLEACSIPDEVRIVDRPAMMLKLLGGVSNYAEELVFSIMKHFGVYIWKGRTYKELDCGKKKNILFGYFQSEKYFSEHSEIIKKELKISKPISEENKLWIDEINRTNAVCLHIRRGDYLKENLIVCDLDYYKNAVAYMKEHLADPRFFVFSDDIEWVKANLRDPAFRYVDNNNVDYDELRLMYHCKHFIMSNSSFSWWAQYLSDNEDKIVIAPPRWMPDDSVPEIYMDSWLVLNR